MTHEHTISREGGGTVVTCACGRIWWERNESVAEDHWRRHLPKDKKEGG